MTQDLYYQHRPSMKSGDVIAFCGKGRVSEIIKWKTSSEYSHVGIVLDTQISGAFGQSVLLIESTSLVNLPDIKTKELIKGVQLHLLSRRLEVYDGKAWWFPLKNTLQQEQLEKMQKWLRSKHTERTPYDTIQAIGAGADLLDRFGLTNEEDFSSLFCSELVTKALQEADIVTKDINASEQTPADVSRFSCFDSPVLIKEETGSRAPSCGLFPGVPNELQSQDIPLIA